MTKTSEDDIVAQRCAELSGPSDPPPGYFNRDKELAESRGGQIYLRDQRIAALEAELATARILARKARSSTAKNSEVAAAISELLTLLTGAEMSR